MTGINFTSSGITGTIHRIFQVQGLCHLVDTDREIKCPLCRCFVNDGTDVFGTIVLHPKINYIQHISSPVQIFFRSEAFQKLL